MKCKARAKSNSIRPSTFCECGAIATPSAARAIGVCPRPFFAGATMQRCLCFFPRRAAAEMHLRKTRGDEFPMAYHFVLCHNTADASSSNLKCWPFYLMHLQGAFDVSHCAGPGGAHAIKGYAMSRQ